MRLSLLAALVLVAVFAGCSPVETLTFEESTRQATVRADSLAAAGGPWTPADSVLVARWATGAPAAFRPAAPAAAPVAAPSNEAAVLARIERNTRTTAVATSITAGLSVAGVILAIVLAVQQ